MEPEKATSKPLLDTTMILLDKAQARPNKIEGTKRRQVTSATTDALGTTRIRRL